MSPPPLDEKTLAGVYRVARNWVGPWAPDAVHDLATAATNDIHAAYLRGEIPKDKLLWYAKRRGTDVYRAEQARKVREAHAAEGRAEVIGRTTTEEDGHADNQVGGRVQEVVDLDATQSSAGGRRGRRLPRLGLGRRRCWLTRPRPARRRPATRAGSRTRSSAARRGRRRRGARCSGRAWEVLRSER